LFHRDDDGSLLLIAANGAADWDPDWFLNLLADPHVIDTSAVPTNHLPERTGLGRAAERSADRPHLA
jgi:hypothetical protein